jgi:hypothetical protein
MMKHVRMPPGKRSRALRTEYTSIAEYVHSPSNRGIGGIPDAQRWASPARWLAELRQTPQPREARLLIGVRLPTYDSIRGCIRISITVMRSRVIPAKDKLPTAC